VPEPDDRELSRTQAVFLKLSGKSAAAIERETREWFVVCQNCGHAVSVWDMGGIRYKAKGNQKTRKTCPSCGERGWHSYERRPEGGGAG
jgi:RNase P subunit RPR2